MNSIEILAPVGSTEALDAAVGEGADAVYLGLKTFNARLRTANFAYSQFEAAVKSLHRMKRRLYVTVNTVFEQRESDRMYQFLKYLATVGPDGIIVQDFGVARMVHDNFPSLRLHASTQMNVASARGVNQLSKFGFNRVVLSRELDLDEIRAIRASTNSELEVFVHGALCVSASGLCLFSSYLGGKSANRGMCTQACRRRYRMGKAEDAIGSIDDDNGEDTAGQPRDASSGYFFSPSDLQLLDKVPELADAGVSSLKIEGRMKSAEYVGIVVSAYRHLVDNLDGDREKAISEASAILRNDFARAKTTFYYDDAKPSAWLDPKQAGGTGISMGTIKRVRGSGADVRAFVGGGDSDFALPESGDSARFHKADDTDRKSLKLVSVDVESKGGCWIPVPEGFGIGDSVYLIQTKAMSRRYAHVLPHDLAPFRRMPGRDTAPPIASYQFDKNSSDGFPDGIYVAVSRVDDLYVVQSQRPLRVILAYTKKSTKRLLEGGDTPIPFGKGEIIISLDPFFPQRDEERLSEDIPLLINAGYKNFIVNNLGHFAFFRGTEARIAAGPYLYTFNRYAYDFVNELGPAVVVTPLENGRQNLDRTVDQYQRKGTVVTVFAYPALFRIRADLSSMYDFSDFTDGRDETFTLLSSNEGSIVVPEKPFSIVDKIPFLKESGFGKFIVDFSGPVLKKRDYKDVMDAVKSGSPLPNTQRFNWKDGFYSPPESASAAKFAPRDAGPRGVSSGDARSNVPRGPRGPRERRS
ncbi:MAG: peptidase U32 family protein [Treponemataceae bacterium]